jgi:DNA-binding beta-propeller fold protein YncE
MHPDLDQLAALLDGAADDPALAGLRAHALTCPRCAARLERLRADGAAIPRALAAVPAPDMREAVRRRARPAFGGALRWAAALAGAAAALLLFTALIADRAGIAVGLAPDRLVVADRWGGQLLELDPHTGEVRRQAAVGEAPALVRYSPRFGRLFVRLSRGVVAVDPRTLAVVARWNAPYPLREQAGLAVDEAAGRVYVAAAGGVFALDAGTLGQIPGVRLGSAPGPLILGPDRRTLYTVDQVDFTLWAIDLASGRGDARLLDRADVGQRLLLAPGPDGSRLYLLRTGAAPLLRVVALPGLQVTAARDLSSGPLPQGLAVLPDGRVAVSRGDGRAGGIELYDPLTLATVAQLDPAADQHALAAERDGTLVALNWQHGTVTRYDLAAGTRRWQTTLAPAQPVDAAFVPGGWRLP